jgi:hypothetical protein
MLSPVKWNAVAKTKGALEINEKVQSLLMFKFEVMQVVAPLYYK